MRGDGRIFKRGDRYWVAYYVNGVEHREPAGTTEADAKRKLKALRKAVASDRFLAPRERRVNVGELLDNLLLHLRNKGARSVSKVESHLKPVREMFGMTRASDVTTPMVERFTENRRSAGKAPATINRELEALRQAFNLAARRTPPLVLKAPHIPLLRAENARQGFIARAEFEAILTSIEDRDVRDFIEFFWWTGMRPNEIRQLTWEMYDAESGTLDLDPRAAKIGKGRTIALEGPLRTIVDRRVAARRLDCTLMFHRVSKGRPGAAIKDIRGSWKAACRKAGLPAGRNVPGGLIPYDLRRCAVRNLVRGGTHETVAMKISGHKTRSTFDRYNIASVDDIRDAVVRTAAYVSNLSTQRKVVGIESFREHGQKTDIPASSEREVLPLKGMLAEAGGNRTHRSGV